MMKLPDDNIETCNAVGKTPQKPYSGKLMLLFTLKFMQPAAQLRGQIINQWASEALNREASL